MPAVASVMPPVAHRQPIPAEDAWERGMSTVAAGLGDRIKGGRYARRQEFCDVSLDERAQGLSAFLLQRLAPHSVRTHVEPSLCLHNGTWIDAASPNRAAGEESRYGTAEIDRGRCRQPPWSALPCLDARERVRVGAKCSRRKRQSVFMKRGSARPIVLAEVPPKQRAPILKALDSSGHQWSTPLASCAPCHPSTRSRPSPWMPRTRPARATFAGSLAPIRFAKTRPRRWAGKPLRALGTRISAIGHFMQHAYS